MTANEQFLDGFDEWLRGFDIPLKTRDRHVRDVQELGAFLTNKALKDATKLDVNAFLGTRSQIKNLPTLHPQSFRLLLAWRQLPKTAICSVCGKASSQPEGWFSIRVRDEPRMWTIEEWDAHPLFYRWQVACGIEHARQLLLEWATGKRGIP